MAFGSIQTHSEFYPLEITSAIISIARVIFHHHFLQRANLGWTVIYYSPYVD